MSETTLPRAPERWAMVPAPDHAPLLEKWATLRLEDAALHAQNAVLQARIRQLRKWWPALWSFARVEGVEPTNNVAERALRPAVLWRQGSFGSNSGPGSRFAERLLTIVAACPQE